MALAVQETSQQKDNLCGPFWAARLLRAFGIDADEDDIAVRAGSVLPDPDDGSVPPGADSKTDYAAELRTGSPEESGTSAQGLLEAIEAAGVSCIPIRGPWTTERVVRLFDAVPPARLLANVRTGPFWSSRPPVEAVIAELAGQEADGGRHEWDVGHFVRLERLIGGGLVLVHDSYPSLGWNGRHLQPARLVAAALERGDGREGGVLAVVPPEDADRVRAVAGEVGIWDNGSRR
ncbi:MAG TPA: hypothetical protein VFU26_01840 [Gaiellaceae bacterium]|nr:hypothetical protein [Gaiellaceae bacterium]